MPTSKTECTELAVGFGLLDLAPSVVLQQTQIDAYFTGTLISEKYRNFLKEFARDEKFYRKFYEIGLRIRRAYPPFREARFRNIQWEGPNKQAATVSVAKDIFALNTPISVKASSDVVLNPSPTKLFIDIPQGNPNQGRAENWYITAGLSSYQQLYSFAKSIWSPSLPDNVVDYHSSIPEKQRKGFAAKIKVAEKLKTDDFRKYQQLYVAFCFDVAKYSAEIFNQHFSKSLSGRARDSVIQTIIRSFFRISDVPYLLCGLDNSTEFGVEIPDLTSWWKTWRFRELRAVPDIASQRGQCVVKFHLVLERRENRQPCQLTYHAEIRWSHGRFCGNPEAKLYKEFLWTQVPFFTVIIGEEPFRKVELIGTGGFGVVYKAINKTTKETVAIKELSSSFQSFHEYERFCREVKLQSTLQHPNIMPVIQSDLNASTPWFVMPLAQNSLEDYLEENKRIKHEPAKLNYIFEQMLNGIRHAHMNQVVHRDLKPANILLFENNHVKICDFGLGKQLDPNNSEWGLTSTSESLGTLYYTAPEQMQSFTSADFRSDIYSLGKILYNCLTGETPFPKLNFNLVNEPYRTIIIRCTAEEPSERYQLIDELLEAFKTVTRV